MGKISKQYKRLRSWLVGPQRQAIRRFQRDEKEWRRLGGEIHKLYPVLTDFDDAAGNNSGHYLHQDLLVASMIHNDAPERHIDVGSRIDGFVAHVASFREIEVLDIRPLEKSVHENIHFLQMDLTSDTKEGITDSLSCLHAVEHFGLGRYSDPISVDGHINGITNMISMLKTGGTFYISFPIGKKNQVQFNAHRIFDPHMILNIPEVREQLELVRFDFVDDEGELHLDKNVDDAVGRFNFGCGIYSFRKMS